jgi:hypothetical protein
MILKMTALVLLFWGALTVPVVSADENEPVGKSFPEVTFDRVNEIFGDNLDSNEERLKTLLLAISMDHTSPESPHRDEQIGIPYIVHFGPGYWVNRLSSGDASLEVLANNALLLLFAEADIPSRDNAALNLMQRAATAGYWPADYFVAETNLINHWVRDAENLFPLANVIGQTDARQIATNAMATYNRCAELGFAPCRYRIGFWLANSQSSRNDGLRVLQAAIDTTLKDTRYEGVLNDSLIMATTQLIDNGERIGLDAAARQHYAHLRTEYTKSLP